MISILISSAVGWPPKEFGEIVWWGATCSLASRTKQKSTRPSPLRELSQELLYASFLVHLVAWENRRQALAQLPEFPPLPAPRLSTPLARRRASARGNLRPLLFFLLALLGLLALWSWRRAGRGRRGRLLLTVVLPSSLCPALPMPSASRSLAGPCRSSSSSWKSPWGAAQHLLKFRVAPMGPF